MKSIVEIDIKDFPIIMDYGIHWRSIKIIYNDGIVGTNLMITMATAIPWLESVKYNVIRKPRKLDPPGLKSDFFLENTILTPMEYFKSYLFINNQEVQKELIQHVYG